MMTASLDAGTRQRLAAEFFCNRDLAKRLLADEDLKRRINTVRRTIGYIHLTNEDLFGYAQSAVAFGFYRALLTPFAAERGLDDDWWTEQRREHARSSKDRTADLDIIVAAFPEFACYFPERGVTDEEVLAAAKIEFRDAIAAPGSDYHDFTTKLRTRSQVASNFPVLTANRVGRPNARSKSTSPRGTQFHYTDGAEPDYIDADAQSRTENVDTYDLLEDDRDIFGPVVTRAMQVALREYGPSALHWLNDLLFFPKKYSDNLRSVGQSEEVLGKSEFERVKRDMVRKIPEIHARMLELLRDDPEIQKLRELFLAPSPAIQKKAKASSPIAGERQAYITRTLKRMRDENWVPKAFTDEQLIELIPAYHAARLDPLKMPALNREVERIRKEGR